ncbi:MAG: hypothetical protein CVV11_11080 [Gammaproteobacteria bacterium HGW-Gammaproteobacteria-15]|nr:MAG: hypothetical protein CVV11_11080 [Gammaproteobacteria bacterium HGW-Gammaproteobacteria-15]
MRKISLITTVLAALLHSTVQADTVQADTVAVTDGVMHWQNGARQGEEVALFGVNYSAPFAYGYRALARLGVDHKQAIDMDVAHMARLGLDAYRIHLWDRQLADVDGNLLQNEHLALFDYLLFKLGQHNIKAIITPIGWWGSGYPEPDPDEQSFATLFSKSQMNQSAKAIAAQQTYLTQILTHINPYTGVSYANDPTVIAFELFNEPKHETPAAQSAAYIEKLIATVRAAGVTKPLFYNTSEQGNDQAFATALCNSSIDGVAYQWYPTGLVKNHTILANMLPTVAHYTDPFAPISACSSKAKMVYEFDAADVASTVMYPAMARSFRAAGFQWATQFAYDPAAMAHTNSDYNTHFLNLLYTPGKAISLMIAAEAFRRLPRAQASSDYPANNQFAGVSLNYAANLSLLNTDDKFIYSNNNQTKPKSSKKLQQIAGVGSSVLAQYSGSGAYFLDKRADGLWQLELYPDLQPLQDPHQSASLQREVARLYQNQQQLSLQLADLGQRFYVKGLNDGNNLSTQAKNGTVSLTPGIYLLAKQPSQLKQVDSTLSYLLPKPAAAELSVYHQPLRQASLNDDIQFSLQLGANEAPKKVELMLRYVGHREFTAIPMQAAAGGIYHAALPQTPAWQQSGLLEYAVSVTTPQQQVTFPGSSRGSPQQWYFVPQMPYWNLQLQQANAPVALFDATLDRHNNLYPKDERVRQDLVSGQQGKGLALRLAIEDLQATAPELLLRVTPAPDNSLLQRDLTGYNTLAIKIRAVKQNEQIELALLNADGLAFGTELNVSTEWQYLLLPLSTLHSTATALPQAFPTFMPALLPAAQAGLAWPANSDLRQLQGVQLRFNAGAYAAAALGGWHAVELAEVSLIKR